MITMHDEIRRLKVIAYKQVFLKKIENEFESNKIKIDNSQNKSASI